MDALVAVLITAAFVTLLAIVLAFAPHAPTHCPTCDPPLSVTQNVLFGPSFCDLRPVPHHYRDGTYIPARPHKVYNPLLKAPPLDKPVVFCVGMSVTVNSTKYHYILPLTRIDNEPIWSSQAIFHWPGMKSNLDGLTVGEFVQNVNEAIIHLLKVIQNKYNEDGAALLCTAIPDVFRTHGFYDANVELRVVDGNSKYVQARINPLPFARPVDFEKVWDLNGTHAFDFISQDDWTNGVQNEPTIDGFFQSGFDKSRIRMVHAKTAENAATDISGFQIPNLVASHKFKCVPVQPNNGTWVSVVNPRSSFEALCEGTTSDYLGADGCIPDSSKTDTCGRYGGGYTLQPKYLSNINVHDTDGGMQFGFDDDEQYEQAKLMYDSNYALQFVSTDVNPSYSIWYTIPEKQRTGDNAYMATRIPDHCHCPGDMVFKAQMGTRDIFSWRCEPRAPPGPDDEIDGSPGMRLGSVS